VRKCRTSHFPGELILKNTDNQRIVLFTEFAYIKALLWLGDGAWGSCVNTPLVWSSIPLGNASRFYGGMNACAARWRRLPPVSVSLADEQISVEAVLWAARAMGAAPGSRLRQSGRIQPRWPQCARTTLGFF
jgi:hypothetical protein